MVERLGRGAPYKAVAAELGVSTSSVNSHRRRAYRKLGVSHLVAAVARIRSRERSAARRAG